MALDSTSKVFFSIYALLVVYAVILVLLIIEARVRYHALERLGRRVCSLCARLSVLEGKEPPCEGYKKAVEAMEEMEKDIHSWTTVHPALRGRWSHAKEL